MDEDEAEDRRAPERRCIVTARVLPKEELIRCVVAPDGTVVPDLDNRLPGRGLWLSPSPDVLKTAAKSAFAKAARRKVTTPPDLAERIEGLLLKRCLGLVGLLRRAGEVVAGFEKARSALKSGQAGLILAACDGADDGRSKLRGLGQWLPVVALLTAEELGAALGRGATVHAVASRGGLAAKLLIEAKRLAAWRGVELDEGGVSASEIKGRDEQSNDRADEKSE